jgi:tripartite motif-containing protein 71
VVHTENHRIQKFDSEGGFVKEWGKIYVWPYGKMGSGDGEFSEPLGVAVDGHGYVYVADDRQGGVNSSVVKLTPEGEEISNREGFPRDVAVDGYGYVYVVDSSTHKVVKLTP